MLSSSTRYRPVPPQTATYRLAPDVGTHHPIPGYSSPTGVLPALAVHPTYPMGALTFALTGLYAI